MNNSSPADHSFKKNDNSGKKKKTNRVIKPEFIAKQQNSKKKTR